MCERVQRGVWMFKKVTLCSDKGGAWLAGCSVPCMSTCISRIRWRVSKREREADLPAVCQKKTLSVFTEAANFFCDGLMSELALKKLFCREKRHGAPGGQWMMD